MGVVIRQIEALDELINIAYKEILNGSVLGHNLALFLGFYSKYTSYSNSTCMYMHFDCLSFQYHSIAYFELCQGAAAAQL